MNTTTDVLAFLEDSARRARAAEASRRLDTARAVSDAARARLRAAEALYRSTTAAEREAFVAYTERRAA